MRVDPNGNKWYDPRTWDWKAIGKTALSVLSIVVGIALCFVPGAQAIGAGLIIFGAGGIIGGIIGAATGYGYNAGWNIGALIGGAIGLAVAAPQLLGLMASISIPTGIAITTAGTLAITTTAVAIPVGAVAVGAATAGLLAGLVMMSRYPDYPTRKKAYEDAKRDGHGSEPELHTDGKKPHYKNGLKNKNNPLAYKHYFFPRHMLSISAITYAIKKIWEWLFGE